jgi:hypothetical protein
MCPNNWKSKSQTGVQQMNAIDCKQNTERRNFRKSDNSTIQGGKIVEEYVNLCNGQSIRHYRQFPDIGYVRQQALELGKRKSCHAGSYVSFDSFYDQGRIKRTPACWLPRHESV